jgi:hypothetical protein
MTVGRIPVIEGGIQPTIFDAKADLLTATANDTPARLAVGTNNQVVMADSAQATGLKYANEATATLTTTGDTLYASGANTLARLAIGSTSQVLTVAGGVPTWATPASGSTFSGASVFNSSSQSHSSGADLTPSFDSEKFDVGGYHDNSTNNSRLTVPSGKTGYFLVSAFLGWSSNSSNIRVIQFIKNGGAQVSRLSVAAANGDTTYANLSDVLYLTAGDYITLQLFQASGSTLTIQSGTANIGFSMSYLGA